MSTVIFKDATLLDCTGAEPVYPATVVVENEQIREISTGSVTSAPQGAEVVDCRGYTLMPGLIDAHIHINMFDGDATDQTRRNLPSTNVIKCLGVMADTLLQGFTSVMDACGADAGYKHAQMQGLIPGPRMQVCGHSISQTGGHADMRLPTDVREPYPYYFNMGVIADGVDAVRRAAREELRMGAEYIKIMAAGGCASPADEPDTVQYSPEELRALVDAADSVGTYCIAHCYSSRSIRRCIEAGVKRIEHGNFMDAETARLMAKTATLYVPTMATYDIMARRGAEFGIPSFFLRKMKLADERAQEALSYAVEAGVVIGSGSDMVGPGQPYKANELALKSRVMGPMGAILSATKVNAEIMKVIGRVGTVETGKLADLLVIEGNPLDDVAVFQNRDKIRAIMQGGKFVKHTL